MITSSQKQAFVAIDFETANEQRRSACALGMVRYDADGNIEDTFYSLIRPHPEVDYFNGLNIHIHGITPERVQDAPQWGDIAESVRGFIGDLPIVAHNMAFDGCVLADLMKLYGLDEIPNRRLCTLRLARKVLADELESKSLDNVYDHYFPGDTFEHHHAYEDADAAARIFVRMQDEYGYTKLEELCPPTGARRTATGIHTDWKSVDELYSKYADSQALIGENVCITGTLKTAKRDVIQELINRLGGQPEKTLTKRVTMLVVGVPNPGVWVEGSSASRKLIKARQLMDKGAKIQVLSEEEFFNQLLDEN